MVTESISKYLHVAKVCASRPNTALFRHLRCHGAQKGLNSREKVVRGEQASKTEPATLGESFEFLHRMFVVSRLTASIKQHLRCLNDLTNTWVAGLGNLFNVKSDI